jgi:hypothetical protein
MMWMLGQLRQRGILISRKALSHIEADYLYLRDEPSHRLICRLALQLAADETTGETLRTSEACIEVETHMRCSRLQELLQTYYP